MNHDAEFFLTNAKTSYPFFIKVLTKFLPRKLVAPVITIVFTV